MPSFGVPEVATVIVIAILVIWPIIYVASGGIGKSLRKARKLWDDADPNKKDEG